MMDLIFFISIPFIAAFSWKYLNDEIRNKWSSLELENYKIDKVTKKEYGYNIIVRCTKEGNIDDFRGYKKIFDKLYQCKSYINNINFTNKINLDIVKKEYDIPYKFMKLSPFELLVGYDYKGGPIVMDMKITPHIGVVGISNNGKTKCVELMLENLRGAEIHVLNGLADDFTNVKCKRINGEFEILDYLYYLTHEEHVHQRPLYIVIDEYNVLNNLKGLDDAIENLLRQARHRNVFVIVIGQQMNKEECNFKNLFNCRLCFKQVSPIQYYSFLGVSVDEIDLQQREFILLHKELVYGKSYKIIK